MLGNDGTLWGSTWSPDMLGYNGTLWGSTWSPDMLGYDGTLWGCTWSLDMFGYMAVKSPTGSQETVVHKSAVPQPSLRVSRQNIKTR